MDSAAWWSPLISLATLALLVLAAIVTARVHDQAQRDRKRRVFKLVFPAELSHDAVVEFLDSVSGSLRPFPFRLLGTPNMVFELVASQEGIGHRIHVPAGQVKDVLPQLRSHMPGVNIEELDGWELPHWTRVLELSQRNITRTLRIRTPEAVATSILASVQELEPGEVVMLQWVVSPDIPTEGPRPPVEQRRAAQRSWRAGMVGVVDINPKQSEILDQRQKLQEHNMSVAVRIAAKADTKLRSRQLTKAVRSTLASVRSPHTRFQYAVTNGLPLKVRMRRVWNARGPVVFPAHLAVSELAALLGWPLGDPHVAGLPQSRTRHLPAPESIPRVGRVVAVSNWPGNERPLAVSVLDSCKHYHVVGRTGSGKSSLLGNLIAQDMERGAGVVVVESKGDLYELALNYVPENRIEDVVLFNVKDTAYPCGFNILRQGSPEIVASEVQTIFNHIYGGEGVRMPEALYHALITLTTSTAAVGRPFTFVDLMPLLWPMSREERLFSEAVIAGVPDSYIKQFWGTVGRFSRAERDKYFEPLRARIWQLNSRSDIRNIIGQSEDSFDIRDIVRNRKILLVNLDGLPEETASLVGSLVINSLWHAIKERLASQSNPVSLVMDEFHHFVHSPISPETMLAEARSFGLSMHLAHQGLDQLTKPSLKSAVMNNAVNKIVFQRGADDARAFAAEFGSMVTEDDFKNLRKFEVLMKLASDEGISPPVTGITREPLPFKDLAGAVRRASRKKFGRSVTQVAAEIQARRAIGLSSQRSRPRLGDETI